MTTDILTEATAAAEKVGGLFSKLYNGAIDLFYTPAVAPATNGTVTPLGALAILGLVVSLFLMGFHFVRNLIRLRG